MGIFLWLLALVCLVIGLAVALPLRLELEIHKQAAWRVVATVRPFGRYGPRIPIRKGPMGVHDEKPRKMKRRTQRHPAPRDLLPAVFRFVTDVLGCIRVGKLTVDARFGFGDPAMTGQAFGMLAPAIYGAPAMAGVDLRVVPVFDRQVLTGAADLAFSVVPITLLGPFLRLGWHLFGPAR